LTKFATFAAVGGFCALLSLAILWLLTSWLGVHYLVSTMITFLITTPVGFWLNKILTFRTRREYARIEWPRYFLIMSVSFASSLALMYLLVSVLGLWYLLANVIVIGLLLVFNFLTHDRWSFRAKR
jgi:putative flippase GtrA